MYTCIHTHSIFTLRFCTLQFSNPSSHKEACTLLLIAITASSASPTSKLSWTATLPHVACSPTTLLNEQRISIASHPARLNRHSVLKDPLPHQIRHLEISLKRRHTHHAPTRSYCCYSYTPPASTPGFLARLFQHQLPVPSCKKRSNAPKRLSWFETHPISCAHLFLVFLLLYLHDSVTEASWNLVKASTVTLPVLARPTKASSSSKATESKPLSLSTQQIEGR